MAAREVAHQLGTKHHEFHFTVEEGIDAVYDLIYHLESYEQVRLVAATTDAVSKPVHHNHEFILQFMAAMVDPTVYTTLSHMSRCSAWLQCLCWDVLWWYA